MKKLRWLSVMGIMASLIILVAACSNEDLSDAIGNNDYLSEKTGTNVSIEEAQADLMSLLTDIDRQSTRTGRIGIRRIRNSYVFSGKGSTRTDSEEAIPVYVFNFENDEGYAIMSGDTRLPSLIALTDCGSLNS